MESQDYQALAGFIIVIGLIIIVVAIAVYVLTSLLMNSVHKKIYGKGTWMAWVPYVRTFLLGKLAVNKLVGIILVSANVASNIFAGSSSSETSGISTLASGISSIVGIASIVFYIMILVKNGKLKNGELSPETAAKQCEAMDFNKVEEAPAKPASEPVNAMPSANPEPANNAPENNPAPVANKFCTNCGSELPENSSFCTNCGTKVE